MRPRNQVSLCLGVLVLTLSISLAADPPLGFRGGPVWAQRSPKEVAAQVYERLPGFPLQNQYTRRDNNQTEPGSTLISRLIQYHAFVKGRSTLFRLDWKITLADYLGLNERVLDETYPGHNFLKPNPITNDLIAIRQLNRAQRAALVQALVDAHNGRSPSDQALPRRVPPRPEAPKVSPQSPSGPVFPKPGSADLLRSP